MLKPNNTYFKNGSFNKTYDTDTFNMPEYMVMSDQLQDKKYRIFTECIY